MLPDLCDTAHKSDAWESAIGAKTERPWKNSHGRNIGLRIGCEW
jgi:hypothetical protein